MDGFYTAKEARTKLHVTEDQFQYMVRTHQVQKVILPGRKYGVYIRADIDELSGILNKNIPQQNDIVENDEEIFRIAQPHDANNMYRLGDWVMKRSGGQGIPPEKLLPFLSIPHSEIGHVLIRNGHLIGYFTIVSLKHDTLIQRMRGEFTTSQLQPEQVVPLEPGEPFDCFVWEIISDPHQKHTGAYLIGKMRKFFHTLGKRGADIRGIYATASSPEGINLCRKLGMHTMDLPGIDQLPGIPFEIKVQEQRTWLTKNYIQALKSYKLRMERLQHNFS